MKKIRFLFLGIFSMIMLSCANDTASKLEEAYEEAITKLESVDNDDDCDKIHMELLESIYDILKDNPDFLKDAEKGNISESVQKKLESAYDEYNAKLREKASSSHYMFMPYANMKNAIQIVEKKKGISSNSLIKKNLEDSTEEGSEEDESEEDESSNINYDNDSEDWDELLDTYDEYVEEYISYLKKAKDGDVDALSEYPALLEKAKEFSEKMEGAEDNMSSSQWRRYNKITTKMMSVASDF